MCRKNLSTKQKFFSSNTTTCLRFRCWIIAVVLPSSLLHIGPLKHFFCLFSVKCSLALEDEGHTDFSAFAMYLSFNVTSAHFFLLCRVTEAPNSAGTSA